MIRWLIFLFMDVAAFATVGVTSQEQFQRLKDYGSRGYLTYNFERAYLEAPSSQDCPSQGRAFFSLHISKEGEVKTVRGRLVALSADVGSVTLKWASALLRRMQFRPLMYGTKPSSVDVAVTLVCTK